MDLRKMSPTELETLIEKASHRRKLISSKRVVKVRERILSILSKQGLSIDEVFTADAGPNVPFVKIRKYKVKPKYRNPGNPAQTWTGRGISPIWFRNALAAGHRKQDMLIQ